MVTGLVEVKYDARHGHRWDWTATQGSHAHWCGYCGFEKQRLGIDARGPRAGFALLGAGWRQVQRQSPPHVAAQKSGRLAAVVGQVAVQDGSG
jgi:hypothetical protein